MVNNPPPVWPVGKKTELAKASGVRLSYLVDIIRGRKRATPENAARISKEAQRLGLDLNRLDLLYPHESTNPLIDIAKPLPTCRMCGERPGDYPGNLCHKCDHALGERNRG